MESNSEHWNALLLSLRELTEWVIRKDTELSQLRSGPLRGDAASLQKQLVSFSISKVFECFGLKIRYCYDSSFSLNLIGNSNIESFCNVKGFNLNFEFMHF